MGVIRLARPVKSCGATREVVFLTELGCFERDSVISVDKI